MFGGRGRGRGEAYTWSNKSVKEKVGLSAGGLYARDGGLIGGEIRYIKIKFDKDFKNVVVL